MAEATDPRNRRQEVAHVQTRTDPSGPAAPNLRIYQACKPSYQYLPQQPTVRVALPADLMDVPQRMNVIYHETRNLSSRVANLEGRQTKPKPAGDPLNHRLKDLEVRMEASGKRCEKLQNETQFAASQWLEYFEKRIQRLENPDEQMQRFENLEKRIQRLEKPDEQMQRFENLEKRMQRFENRDEQMQRFGQGCEQSHNETGLAIEDVRVSLTAIMKRLDDVEEAEAKAAGNGQQFEGLVKKVTANEDSLNTVRVLFSDLIHGQPSTGQKRKGELILSTRTLRSRAPKK